MRHTVLAREVQDRRVTVNAGLVTVLAAGGGGLQVSYGIRDSAGAGAGHSPESPVHVSLLGL
ncbi:hypothetical protein ACIRL2_40615 [Embleya sp. NPDC127516]|uniref:hypothetical protein n=1 Tax=Embleya sp. NPDC127516 TaxID=3363990 RepID=UPI003828411B